MSWKSQEWKEAGGAIKRAPKQGRHAEKTRPSVEGGGREAWGVTPCKLSREAVQSLAVSEGKERDLLLSYEKGGSAGTRC